MSSYDGCEARSAGVSRKADAIVERLRAAVASTGGDVGGFAGLYQLDDERLLAATTDGVGTKLVLFSPGRTPFRRGS